MIFEQRFLTADGTNHRFQGEREFNGHGTRERDSSFHLARTHPVSFWLVAPDDRWRPTTPVTTRCHETRGESRFGDPIVLHWSLDGDPEQANLFSLR